MIFKTNAFSYVTTILMILSLKMATNDGEMLYHLADSNLEYCLLRIPLILKLIFITVRVVQIC